MRRRQFAVGGRRFVEFFDGTRRSDHSTRYVGEALGRVLKAGDVVAEIGCGTGVLAMSAAARGAGEVWAVDLDPAAVALCAGAARENGFAQLRAVHGGMLDPVPRDRRIDLVLGILPQKPAPLAFSMRYAGGEDGADLICGAIAAAAARLPTGGQLLIYHHSIAHPARVASALSAAFDWGVISERTRCFSLERYERQAPGMLAHLAACAAAGRADVRFGGAYLHWDSRVLYAVRR